MVSKQDNARSRMASEANSYDFRVLELGRFIADERIRCRIVVLGEVCCGGPQ